MLKKSKNQEKIKVNFTNGYVILDNYKTKTIYLDEKGVYFRLYFKKIYLNENNCEVI